MHLSNIVFFLNNTFNAYFKRNNNKLMLSKSLRHCIVLFFLNIDTNIAEICFQHPDFVTGSPTDCHRFYNCSEESSFFHQMSSWPTPFLHKCPYPFLFSEESLQCENYTDVVCGTRFEATWECK